MKFRTVISQSVAEQNEAANYFAWQEAQNLEVWDFNQAQKVWNGHED